MPANQITSETDQLLEGNNNLKMTKKETENVNQPSPDKEIELIYFFKSLVEKILGLYKFSGWFYQTLKEEIMPNL